MAPDQQYYVSKAEQNKILRRAELREKLRREYLKQITDPYRHGKGEGGYVFDPAVQRYLSMKATPLDQFKPTLKSFNRFVLTTFLPIGLLYYFFHNHRKEFERKCRSGEIPYKDRNFKFT